MQRHAVISVFTELQVLQL